MTTATTLQDRAMLVDLTVRQWAAGKTDRKVSDEVATQYNSDRSMGHYYKNLLARETLERIRRIGNAAFNEHYYYTLPWATSGARILSSAAFFYYMKKMREWKDKYQEAVDEFVTNYESYVADAAVRQNGLFRKEDYPSAKEVSAKFGFNYQVFPLPAAGDFRVDLGTAEIKQIRKEIEESNKEAMRKAMAEVAARVSTVIEHMNERLKAYSGGMNGSFRDTLVSNVREMAELIPALNITNDPQLDGIAKDMLGILCQYDANTLRSDETARETTADAAAAILARVKEFAI